MSGAPVVLLVVFIAGVLMDSGPESRVILLPDPDGSVGTVEVSSGGGKMLLTEAGQMTRVAGASQAPSAPVKLSEESIQRDFSALFVVEPPQPVKFLLYFEQDSTQLVAESKMLLPQIFTAIEDRRSQAIGVYGHCDRIGSDDYNMKLSLQRALAIRDLLSFQGVDPQSIDVASHGEGNPLIQTADEVSEPRNRRVEVIIR